MEAILIALLEAILPVYSGFVPVPLPDAYGLFKSDRKNDIKTLLGWTGLIDQSFELDIMTKSYNSLITYFNQVQAMLKALEKTTQTYYIQSVKIDENCPELWESEVKMHRKYITFTISYQI